MTPRQWAVEVVRKLQSAGYQAMWAGGCVRDSLLNIAPKDFDVATSATPDEVQRVFAKRKTLAIGKSFGVITVVGPKSAGNIEVATFRRDGGYSDGRRPDSVEFTNAKEDALRRDFTINGMFFDPVSEEVIDYVGGKADLRLKQIRAIGDADQRIDEDRLRMLRGIRFAATYGFEIEPSTMAAIQNRAADIDSVSPERIGSELRRMLTHCGSRALPLLVESKLWAEVLPAELGAECDWTGKARLLEFLDADFATALAAIFGGTGFGVAELQGRWRLTNDEVARSGWILAHEPVLREAVDLPWSSLQPMLVSEHASHALRLLRARIDASAASKSRAAKWKPALDRCAAALELEPERLNPAPLVTGADLKQLGVSPGPQYKAILNQVRKLQLDGELEDRAEARQWILESGSLHE